MERGVEGSSGGVLGVKSHIRQVYGAVRLLLLPLLGLPVSCRYLERLVNEKTVNYLVEGWLKVVKGVGSRAEGRAPCVLDPKRMTPFRFYIRLGLLDEGFEPGPLYPLLKAEWRHVAKAYRALPLCRAAELTRLAPCLGLSEREAAEAVAVLRTLYPSVVEVVYRAPFSARLGEVGSRMRTEDYWSDLYYFIERGVVVPRPRPFPLRSVVRAASAKYAIPAILNYVDFSGAVVADVGSGFGTKGAYSIRRGARFVVLIDIDESVLRERGRGALVDKVVGDAHLLPLRDRGVDVVILWNVLPFVHDEGKVFEEVDRVVKRCVVLSVYNTATGRQYTWHAFLKAASRLGAVVKHKRLANAQFQAVVCREN